MKITAIERYKMKSIASHPPCRNQEVDISYCTTIRHGDSKGHIHALVSWLHLNPNFFVRKYFYKLLRSYSTHTITQNQIPSF